jgi:hypothetical protein
LETYFKGLLTENRERYLREQESELGLNEIGMDKINLDTEIVKMTIKSLKVIHHVELEEYLQNY